jgi:O-antigen/teichoic acid export membrane protein
VFLLLFWYADVLIPLVFTDRYAEAVPIFRILLLILPLEAIELNSPLRAANRTQDLLSGNLLMLACNLACIYVFFRYYPDMAILGPAVGVVIGYSVARIYMGWRVMRFFEIPLSELLKWRSQAIIVLCTAASGSVLFAGDYVPLHDVLRILVFSVLYAGVYFLMLRRFRLEEVETVISRIGNRIGRSRR